MFMCWIDQNIFVNYDVALRTDNLHLPSTKKFEMLLNGKIKWFVCKSLFFYFVFIKFAPYKINAICFFAVVVLVAMVTDFINYLRLRL